MEEFYFIFHNHLAIHVKYSKMVILVYNSHPNEQNVLIVFYDIPEIYDIIHTVGW